MINNIQPALSFQKRGNLLTFLLTSLFLFLITGKLYSQELQTVDQSTAESVAKNFCLKTDKKYSGSAAKSLTISLAETKLSGSSSLYYVFNINNDDGFIIISADINSVPVLCYVPKGSYKVYPDSRPPAFNDWLSIFSKQIDYSEKNPSKSRKNVDLWNALLSKGSLDLEQLALPMTSTWHQTFAYNGYSPVTGVGGHPDSGSDYDSRTPTGCVATAMGQIMYYNKWPLSGTGSHSYVDAANNSSNPNSKCGQDDPSYGTLGFFNHTNTYNWALMENHPYSTNYEISRLCYNAAVSVDMDFAYCQSWTNTFLAAPAYSTYFGYNTAVRYVLRADYSATWDSLIKDQIRKERLVQYRGQSPSGAVGHSWVCYGYQVVGGLTQYLFNFGWGGYANGYYTLDQLSDAGGNNLTSQNGAVIDIFPTLQPNLNIPTASLSTTSPQTLIPFTVNFNIANTGNYNALSSTAKCYFSTDNKLDKNDIFLNSISIPAISSGSSYDAMGTLLMDDYVSGDYYILIEADTYHEVHESDETDNVKAIAIHLIQSPANTGDYKSVASGSWTSPSTWQYYNGSDWVPATLYPTATSGTVSIMPSHNITVSNNISIDQVTVSAGGQVTVSAGYILTIADGADAVDFSVSGTIVNNGTITSNGVLKFNDGSVYQHAQDGGTIPVATWTVNSTCLVTGTTGVQPDIPAATQPFGNFTYNCTNQSAEQISLYGKLNSIAGNFTVMSTGGGYNDLRLGRTSDGNLVVNGNFVQTGGYFIIEGEGYTYNSRSMTVLKDVTVDQNANFMVSYISGVGTLNVGGNLNVTGNFYFAADDIYSATPATVNISGNLNITGGLVNLSPVVWYSNNSSIGTLSIGGNLNLSSGTLTENAQGSGNIIFNGSAAQVYSNSGTLSNTINFKVNSGAYLQFGTGAAPSIIPSACSGTFTLLSGATLGVTSAAGITSTGATGNIQLTGPRSFNTGANYVYSGSGTQQTGSGLPATIASLSVSGTSNLSLTSSPLTVTSSLNIASGANLNIGAAQQVTTANFDNSGTMIISSSALNVNGSFIASGTLTQTGTVTYNRQLRVESNFGDRHFFSSPVQNNTALNSSKVTNIWQWNEPVPAWSILSMTAMESGKGYNMDQTSASDGLISFTGSVVSSATVSATSPYKAGYTDRSTPASYGVGNESADIWAPGRSWTNYGAGGWNLLGNPFTSAMNAGTFITSNSSALDPNYLALYVYDATTNHYLYVANTVPGYTANGSFGDKIQVGQGFFVLALNNGSSFNFTSSMQLHNSSTSVTKSGSVQEPWPGLQLKLKYGEKQNTTTVVYNENMNPGLDPGYDVGLYSSGSEMELYTSLATGDNGVSFTRQALPVENCEKYIIPVGISSEKGGIVTFSADVIPLPFYSFYLEDKVTGTMTDLSEKTYTVPISEKTYGYGRFYLHASSQKDPGDIAGEGDQQNIVIWHAYGNVFIKGILSSSARVELFDLNGRKVLEVKLGEGDYNSFSLPDGLQGIYLVKVTDALKSYLKKLVIL